MNNSAMVKSYSSSRQLAVKKTIGLRLLPPQCCILIFWSINDKDIFSEARTDRVEQKTNI